MSGSIKRSHAALTALAISSFAAFAACAEESSTTVGELVVTAQKRVENVNDVGMSINAVSGDELLKRGITDPTQLSKVAPGFVYNSNVFGNPIYSLRGVGFQDSSLGASPTVSVYVDEVPIPFSAATLGASLDLERVEILKGPQGTLYGENATGGAINYITAKPTDTLQAGADVSFGRFSTADIQGFVSGPVSNTLKARLSLRALEGSNWQESYTSAATLGQQNLIEARLLLDWRPTQRLRVNLNLNAWQDQSDSPAPQLIGIVGLGNAALFPPLVAYPHSPADDRAADWDPNRQYRRNNIFYMGALRIDYDVTSDITFTSISSDQRYTRFQPIEADGTALQDLYLVSHGYIDTVYEEARLAGSLPGQGHWIVGGNYEHDKVYDRFFEQFAQSTSREIFGLPLEQTGNFTNQNVDTYAVYGSADYNLTDKIDLQGGVRYTKSDRSFTGCSQDTNGQLAAIFDLLQQILKGGSFIPIPVGGCANLDAMLNPALASGSLNEDNVSWRAGVKWKAAPRTLLYANVSKGYKAGSFPTLSASSTSQFTPANQESVLAYEAGFKSTLLDGTLQLNGAGFYYDYNDKQILGRIADPIFGPLLTLVNVPQSHVVGFELQAVWLPVPGLTITPDISYVHSRIDGDYVNYNSFGDLQNFTGEPFPNTPEVQANLGVEYRWNASSAFTAFVGGDLTYQSRSNGSFGQFRILTIDPYALLDLRAGIESKNKDWRLTLWGRNVTNQYYWNTAIRDNDTINRYAGMPVTFGATVSYRYR